MFLGLIVLLVSVLLLFSISVDIMVIIDDFRTLQSAQINFIKILKLDLPEVNNPIGPFGAYFGYYIYIYLGEFLSRSLLLAMFLLSFFSIFFQNEKKYYLKIFCFLLFALFFNFIMFILRKELITPITKHYSLPYKAFEFMLGLFEKTGTMIISIVVVLTTIVFIFDFRNIKLMFIFLFGAIFRILTFLYKIIKPKKHKEKKIKPVKVKKIKAEKNKRIDAEPNIIDHNFEENNTSINEPVTPDKA